MRWRHPVVGEIPPDVFINGRNPADDRAANPSPARADRQRRCGVEAYSAARRELGLNISPAHLQADSFRDDMLRFAAALPADHFHVVLEVTERAMIDKKNRWLTSRLHRRFEIAIDDFGTGHSALIYLERYNFDYLKIDRGFVQAIGTETVTSPVLDAVRPSAAG